MARIAEKGISPQSILSERRDARLESSRETKVISKRKAGKRVKKEPKPDTRLETLRMIESGLTIAEIANERDLTTGTIVNHICLLITNGKLSLNRFVSPEKENAIRKLLPENIYKNLDKLPPEVTISDIKMVIADGRRNQRNG